MRSVFGNIKTPFNKQRLLDELYVLLSREDIRGTIGDYIDGEDRRLITAIALLDEPGQEDLETFFAREYSYMDFHGRLLNLEERLILYRFKEEGIYRLALNPVLEPVLLPLIEDRGLLFPSVSGSSLEGALADASGGAVPGDAAFDAVSGTAPCPASEPRLLAALCAFAGAEEELFKEGGLKKKALEDGKRIFPGLDLEGALSVLGALRLFDPQGMGMRRNEANLRAFAALPVRARCEYWAAGLLLSRRPDQFPGGGGRNDANGGRAGESNGTGTFYFRGQLCSAALFIHRFLKLLEPGRIYPPLTLGRFITLLRREGAARGMEHINPFIPPAGQGFTGFFLGILREADLLDLSPQGWGPSLVSAGEGEPEGSEKPVIAMDSASSIILYPEISCIDALVLSDFCSVLETGVASVRFGLSREAAVRGFDRGMSAAAMSELLSRLSGNRLEGNLLWTLKDWEARYAEISLHEGIVLTLSEDRRYLAETGPLSAMISRTLAPGVYLLSAEEKQEVLALLRKTGAGIIAQPASPRTEGVFNPFPVLNGGGLDGILGPRRGGSGGAGEGNAAEDQAGASGAEEESPGERAKARMRKRLLQMDLPRNERDELAARIERRLVLSESQLEGAEIKYEKLEARGLDYAGKALIAKQALSAGSLLEVFWPDPQGGSGKILGTPEALEKKGGESLLVIRPLGEGDEKRREGGSVKIPIGKISLLRRVKQSIFGE
jgi:hypothetical protein